MKHRLALEREEGPCEQKDNATITVTSQCCLIYYFCLISEHAWELRDCAHGTDVTAEVHLVIPRPRFPEPRACARPCEGAGDIEMNGLEPLPPLLKETVSSRLGPWALGPP